MNEQFLDAVAETTDTLYEERSGIENGNVHLVLSERGMNFSDLHEVWDFDVQDVQSVHSQRLTFVEVEVNDKYGDDNVPEN